MAKIPQKITDMIYKVEAAENINTGVIITVSESNVMAYVAGVGDIMFGMAMRDIKKGEIITIDFSGITKDVAVKGIV